MLKEGMYISYYEYDNEGKQERRIGQWINEKKENSLIFSHRMDEKGKLLIHPMEYPTHLLKRAEIKPGIKAVLGNEIITIIRKSKREVNDGYALYYCASEKRSGSFIVPENEIKVQYTDVLFYPEETFLDGDFCNPKDMLDRINVKNYIARATMAPDEFSSVIGSRIQLLEHQIDTIKRVLSRQPIRAILADEVGLGKTIEALVILDYALKQGICKRCLIIVPEQLRYQWCYEAKSKFQLQAKVFMFHEFRRGDKRPDICVISDNDYVRYYQDFNWKIFDFVICDEVHRAVRRDSLYSCLLKIAKETKNILLLSATPLLQRGKEMFRLLRLYEPEYYTSLRLEGFNSILKAREAVIEKIDRVSYGFKMKSDLDHANKCIFAFREIANDYDDVVLRNFISTINENDEEQAVNGVNVALDYINKKYEVSPKYIRHRRADILDSSSKRCLYKELEFYFDSYDISGENALYQTIREEIEQCVIDNAISVDDIMLLGSALFSSIVALNRILIDKDLYQIMPRTYKLVHLQLQKENASLSNSRLETLVEYLKNAEELQSKKTIIFTDFYLSADLITKRLIREFGHQSVFMFATGSNINSNVANNSFKTLNSCKFLVCDKSGAEGKNFQFADYIIHYDTPWIPTDLEQRIGRLDRIGRGLNRPVNNIVICSKDSIEEDLIAMCRDDLNVYEESLSGIEIVFDQLIDLIKNSIKENALLGFDLLGDDIREFKLQCENTVQQEEFERMCHQASDGYEDRIQKAIERLTGSIYEKFVDGLCAYHEKKGYEVRLEEKTVFLEDYLHKNGVTGTFLIEEALKEEDIDFLTINNQLVKTICTNCIGEDSLRVSALAVRGANFEWKGFLTTWELQLYIREYFRAAWNDSFEKVPNSYVENSILTLASNEEKDGMSGEYLLHQLINAVEEDRYFMLSLEDIEEDFEYDDLEEVFLGSVSIMRKRFKDRMRYEIDFESLEKEIKSAKRANTVSRMLKLNVADSENQLASLVASKQALENLDCKLDNIIYVRFER